ncbi:MAG: MFS transporter, partial [Gammaproteobacteria bacterium]
MGRIVGTALAGASIEWYDFFIYGVAAATVFPALFFPGSDPLTGVLLSFGTFAVGFVARPVGGVLFGHYGDRAGRKKSLVLALLLMGIATTGIGLLPTYGSIGVAAPLLLIVLRFLQGMAIGGQWGGAVLLLVESAPPGKRGFYGSFAQVGVPRGVILANLVFLLVAEAFGDAALQAWAWRIPFLLSIVLIGIGVYIQLRLEESPAFVAASSGRKTETTGRSPVLRVLRDHPRTVALAAGAFVAINGSFYIFITWIVAYATKTLGMAQSSVLAAVMLSSVAQAPALVIAAALSDRLGRRQVFMSGAALLGLWGLVFFPLVDQASFLMLVFALAVGQTFNSMMYGPQAALFGELFPVETRYSGASLGYQLGAIFGGAFAPLIATGLLA